MTYAPFPVWQSYFGREDRGLHLTDSAQLEQLRIFADEVLSQEQDPARLEDIELDWASHAEEIPLGAQLAIKMARSKALLRRLDRGFHLSVIFAVYKEDVRILSPSEHPDGEDFLRQKISQLRWLFAGLENGTWDLSVVDDGCPNGSGRLAEEIIVAEGESDRCRVIYLAEAIQAGHPVTSGLTSVDESRKGGSILLGMAEAVQMARSGHVVLFTDADLSTHLGQSGLLIDQILSEGYDLAAGSRREPSSIVVKKGGRNLRGKLFIYLWKGLLPELEEITDTQCGFKAFAAETVREIVYESLEKQFAFDVELLLRAQLLRPGSITRVPIAWIDSEAQSTTTDLQPYLSMLKKMAAMYRRYLPSSPAADQVAEFIDSLDEGAWQRLVASVPESIAEREPSEFSGWRGVSIEELKANA